VKRSGVLKGKTWVLICPRCESRVVYYRHKTKTYACRRCGNVWASAPNAKSDRVKSLGGMIR
jgi:ribosomal protein L37AE/L43A